MHEIGYDWTKAILHQHSKVNSSENTVLINIYLFILCQQKEIFIFIFICILCIKWFMWNSLLDTFQLLIMLNEWINVSAYARACERDRESMSKKEKKNAKRKKNPTSRFSALVWYPSMWQNRYFLLLFLRKQFDKRFVNVWKASTQIWMGEDERDNSKSYHRISRCWTCKSCIIFHCKFIKNILKCKNLKKKR